MQFVVGNLRKFFLSVKTRPGIFLVAFAVALILAGWRFWDFHHEVSHTYIRISMKSSIDGTAQLYYDLGSGLSETDSVSVFVTGDRTYHDYQFQLPEQSIYGIRFDPLMSEGTVAIRYFQWMDGRGAVLQSINLKQLRPLNQIGSFTFTDQEVEVVTNQKVNDPQIGVQLSQPLTVGRGFSFLRHPVIILRILIEFVALLFVVTIFLSFWHIWRKNIALLIYGGKIPFAVLLSFLAIITIEIMQQAKLPATASYHDLDALLYHLSTGYTHADYVLLGDSVGSQVFQNTPYLQNNKYAFLATVQAVTMTGQYFIAKRYLQRNKMPHAVIILIQPVFHSHLDDPLSDNYIQRTFTNFSEIFEIFLFKRDPVFTTKMIAYRLLPSFKYRLFLQKHWADFRNADIVYNPQDSGARGYSLLRIIKTYMEKENIPQHHFETLLNLLNNRQIPLFFLVPAICEGNIKLYQQYSDLCAGLFPQLKQMYHNFHYYNDAHFLQAEYFYHDRIHLNEAGLKIETHRFLEKIIDIEKHVN